MRWTPPSQLPRAQKTDTEETLTLDGVSVGSELKLWQRHLYMGIGSFLLGGLTLIGYLALTRTHPHRGTLMVIDIAAILVWIFVIGPVGRRSLRARWRDAFFFCWSVATLVVIAVPVAIDGGAGSPLVGLLVLPVLFGGLLYRLRAVIGLVFVALGCFGVVYIVGQPVSGARALATAIMVAIAGAISAMASMNRHLWEVERRSLTERLHALATHDGLTGCLNHQAFWGALTSESERATRYRRSFSVVIADLDEFKAVNDLYGHGVGDSTLTGVVRAMLASVRSTDLVGRIGGDEFAVLLPETSNEEIRQVVERIRSQISVVLEASPVTVSFGVSSWHGDNDSLASLVQRADLALYEAKRQGRNTVAFESGRRHLAPGYAPS